MGHRQPAVVTERGMRMRDDERIEQAANDEEHARRVAAIFDAPLAWSDDHVLHALAAREERSDVRGRRFITEN